MDGPVPPPGGWRPPTLNEQFDWILVGIISVTVISQVIFLATWMSHPYEYLAEWVKSLWFCSSVPLLVMSVVSGIILWIRRRR